MSGQTAKISLCIIARNEEIFLPGCLNSALPFVDEIILVDTGSTDRTAEIAKEAGARVHSFAWNDDFSAARNYGLEQATGDWILWLDADEHLEVADGAKWRSALFDSSAQAYAMRIVSYCGVDEIKDDQAILHAQIRLFRNGLGFRFEHRVHEQLNVRTVLPELRDIPFLPAQVHHFGYMDSIVEARDKWKRNEYLLATEQEQPNYSPWVDYHLANLYYNKGKHRKAVDWVNQSIRRFLERGEAPPSMLYKLKYEALLAEGKEDVAKQGIDKALAMYPDYVDLHFIKGKLLYSERRYGEAEEQFQKCLALGEANPSYVIQKGVGSDLARRYAERCKEAGETTDKDGGERR